MTDEIIKSIRPIDRKRIESLKRLHTDPLANMDIGFTHSVFAQCFLPYRDPKAPHWVRRNGQYSIIIDAGTLTHPSLNEPGRVMGLPYGSRPRLFQNYFCTLAIRNQSPIIPIERSMTAMIKELQIRSSGGKQGTMGPFKEQIKRYAASHFRIAGPDGTHINAGPFKVFKVWFSDNPNQKSLWPEEIILSDDFFYSLKHHAIPFNFKALIPIKNNSRAQDIFLWMTQRLCRISCKRPLLMTWEMLFDQFGGDQISLHAFQQAFNKALLAARSCYPDARIQEHPNGWIFYNSPAPVRKTKITAGSVEKPVD